jgi:uncharacterized membrane protein
MTRRGQSILPHMSVHTAQHPYMQERKHRQAPQVADEQVGFNGRLAVFITRLVGTMWAVYFITAVILLWMALGTWGPLHSVDPYPFAFLLFLANVAELMLLSVIMVGQSVLGKAADSRALQTFQDAEAILHEVGQLHQHLFRQDQVLNHGVSLVEHQPHSWMERRKETKPVRVADHFVGLNGRIAAAMTRAVGTMWAFYTAAVFQIGWMGLALLGVIKFDPYPFAFMLFMSSLLQLILEFVIMVGQDVLGKAADSRSQQTYLDAEAILHECLQLQHHLSLQDEAIARICAYIEEYAANDHPVRAVRPTQPAPVLG